MNNRSNTKTSNPGLFRHMIGMFLNMVIVLGLFSLLIPEVRGETTATFQTGDVDAAFFHRGENASYFFKGNQYYRLTGTNVDAGYPKTLPGEWKGLPASFHSGIDAAVQDPYSNVIFFFKGDAYSAFLPETKTAVPGYDNVKLPGGWQGLPPSFHSGIDAALEDSGSVILYKGTRQAVITNQKFVNETDIPQGVLAAGPISAAFQYSNGRNYFFSGSKVSRAIGFNVEPGWPNEIKDVWIGMKSGSTGKDVTEVRIGMGNSVTILKQINPVTWEIIMNGRAYSTCRETNRDEWTVYLKCPERTALLDLYRKELTYTGGGAEDYKTAITFASNTPLPKPIPELAPLSDEDMKKVMQWIATEVAARRMEYCYRAKKPNTAGVPMICKSGYSQETAGLCNKQCGSDERGIAGFCYKNCPQGYADNGLYCGKPAAQTREGFPWQPGDPPLPNYSGPISRCETKYGRGNCEQNGAVIYPRCKAGFRSAGSDVCSPECPAGWEDIGVSCKKPSSVRDTIPVSECPAGVQKDPTGALCYPSCPDNFHMVGPVCWQNCTSRYQSWDCGVGCAVSQNTCATVTADMVFGPINAVLSIASLGLDAAATKAAKIPERTAALVASGVDKAQAEKWAITASRIERLGPKGAKLAEILDKVETATTVAVALKDRVYASYDLAVMLDDYAQDYEGSFGVNTSREIDAKINEVFGTGRASAHIKQKWAKYQIGLILEDAKWNTAKTVLENVGAADPTGIVAMVNAFVHPECQVPGSNPFPQVRVLYR